MKKGQNVAVLATVIAIAAVLWMILAAVITLAFQQVWDAWGTLTMVVISTIIAELYLLGLRKDPGEQATEVASLGVMATIGYMVVVFLVNTVFALKGYAGFSWALAGANVVITAVYVVVLLATERQTARVTEQLVRTEKKLDVTRQISAKLGDLLAAAEDPEVKNQILKIKEAVDYSTNISTNATAFAESQVLIQLDEVLQLMLRRADKAIILDKLGLTERTWKMRSSAASTQR